MDFTQICRVCLQRNKQTYDIYTTSHTKRNILYSEMLSNCTKVKPSQEDGLPRLICKDCCKQLRKTYAFNIRCEDSDLKLKQCLDNKCNVSVVNDCQDQVKNEEQWLSHESFSPCKDEPLTAFGNGKQSVNITQVNGESRYGDELSSIKDEENKNEDIKVESDYTHNADGFWDNEDDTCLDEIRERKKEDPTEHDKKTKKKRGRKKRVYLEGEIPLVPSKLPHQCDICGKILSTKSNLKAHKICHTDLRPFKCSDCPATFRGHSALFQHKKVHTKETPYHCEYCPKQFSRRTGLLNHIRMHTGEKLYGCEICFKKFVQSAQLLIHMKRHKGDKTFLCQDCGKGFPIKADLKVHQRIHNGEKPYACHLCVKTFATSGNLSIHVRIHNKEIRYNCKVCQRGFVTRSAFNVHVKRHKGQKDYHCECGKTFYTSSALKQHKVVHTGLKKYQCKICERKFTQTSHLSRHFKRDHMKPNDPMPSSDFYKTVVQDRSEIFNLMDVPEPKMVDSAVKCES